MFDQFIAWLKGLREAGKEISGKNAEKLQQIHDHTIEMGAACVVPSTEAKSTILHGDIIPLVEAAAGSTVPVKIIQAGWGSSGYYGEEMLKRDGPALFRAGTHMYWDHPTSSEEWERPERSLRDLAATLATDAVWQEHGKDGPGLYANAEVTRDYMPIIEELAPHIGVSIRASGTTRQGDAEGRTGTIIEQIVSADSVDFVTRPGAGGKVLQLFEAARGASEAAGNPVANIPAPRVEATKENTVNEDDAKALRESNAALQQKLSQLEEAQLLRDGRALILEALAVIEMPAITRQRLAATLQPVIESGVVNTTATTQCVQDAAKAELEYLARVGSIGGSVRGLGESTKKDISLADAQANLAASFQRLGLSESAAKSAATGRQ